MKRILTAGERDFFAALFSHYDAAGLPHAQARNFEEFPQTIGNDVDLLIPRDREAEAHRIFRELLRAQGGELWQENRRDYVLDLRFTLPGNAQPLHLDLYWGVFTWHGLAYVDETTALQNAHPLALGRGVRPAHEAMGLIFGSLLWGGFYKARYFPRLKTLLADATERMEFDRCCVQAFGAVPFPPQTEPAAESVRALATQLRRQLEIQSAYRQPLRTPFAVSRHWIAEIRTLFSPAGLSLAVLGPDGSGKSTVLAALAQQLEALFVSVHSFHWRPALLPDVGVLLGQRQAHSGPVSDPHSQPPHSAPVSIARLLWYATDYWLGHLLKVRKIRAQSGLVLFDRHAADMWCDSRRYRFGLPREFIRSLTACLPRTELTFVLLPDTTTLIARKNEVPASSLESLLTSYRELAQSGSGIYGIDATQPVDKVVSEIMVIVAAYLKARVGA